MLTMFRTMIEMLDSTERRRAIGVFALTLCMAIIETLGVASVMPFIAVLANPEVIETNRFLKGLYDFLGFSTKNGFLVFLGCATLVFLLSSILLRALTLWAQLRFMHLQNHKLGSRLVAGYLSQPYAWFLDRHSSRLSVNILSEVSNVIHDVFFTTMNLVSNIIISALLLTLLLMVDAVLAISIVVVIGSVYFGVFFLVNKYLARLGRERVAANRGRFRAVNEAFGAIKDIKIAGLEKEFLARFERPSLKLAHRSIAAMVVSEFPSFVMQALIFGGMVSILVYLVADHGGVEGALPLIALYALAGYRLMPALQGIYRCATKLRVSSTALDAVHRDLMEIPAPEAALPEGGFETDTGVALTNRIDLRDVSFRYPGAEQFSLENISISIPALSTVGLVGTTGSGKSTIVDLLLGLLIPTQGEVCVDGRSLSEIGIDAWQKKIGYVPQSIFLSDDSIAANIAFGIPVDQIDMLAVKRAAQIANLHEFVESELPKGYETEIGERGVRLSGGQRQRIGIARAIYRDPEVLVFDEATSALDSITEHAVMDAISQLMGKKTLVLVAHRLSTVRSCDNIFLLEQGRVQSTGSYEQLVNASPVFKQMVRDGV